MARALRGVLIAVVATIVAAVSHMAAGGNTPTFVALIATALIALPLVTIFASKRAGWFGTFVAVAFTQGLFHTLFVYAGTGMLGSTQSGSASFAPEPLHAAHMRALESFVPNINAGSSADAYMWAAHALASLATVWLIRRGDAALQRLEKSLRRTMWPIVPTPVIVTFRRLRLAGFQRTPKISKLFYAGTFYLRGPPVHS